MIGQPDHTHDSIPAVIPGTSDQVPGRPALVSGRMPIEPESIIDIRRYLAALVRYKWLIIGSPFVGLSLGILGSRVIRPDYGAQATVWIEAASEQKGPETGPIRSQQLLRSYSWVELLKSTLVLDAAVADLRLYLKPADPADSAVLANLRVASPLLPGKYRLVVSPAGDSTTLIARGKNLVIDHVALGDSVGSKVGLRWAPPAVAGLAGKTVDFAINAPRNVSIDLSKKLMARVDQNGNFLRVDLAGTEPTQVAAIVNGVVQRYVEVAAELKRAKLTELARILDEQLRQAEENLRYAENALESFRVQTITLPSERATPVSPGLQSTRDPVMTNFFSMRIDLDQVRQDHRAIERALEDARNSEIPIEALSAISTVQQSELMMALRELTDKRAELRAMRYRYTDEHPPLRQLADAIATIEKKTIPALAALLLSDLTAREAALNSRINSASGELRQIPPRVIQEARLERQVTIADNLFTTLQQRYEEARLAEVSSIPDVRILEKAIVPQIPLKNITLLLLLGGLAGGLGIGVGMAVLLDHNDRRVRYPTQVTAGLGLPILGAVPHLKNGGNGADAAPLIEAFRGIQLNLGYAFAAGEPLVMTVTSPGAGDGKSFVAANLALAFADAGHSTILIDGDIRRGTLHRLLAAARVPGLTDVLSGAISAETAAQKTEFPRLDFVAGGEKTADAPELLGSEAMPRLLAGLRSRYAVVIVDSPPLGAGVDAYALSAATGNLLVVLRTGSTDRSVAESKLDMLDRFPVRIFGAIINDVKQDGVYGSYSYYMAGYEYQLESGDSVGRKLLGSGK
jgi:polysaccharide biosynthesis transport protein